MERAAWLERRFGAEIEWLPFDLHPEYPLEGLSFEQLEAKYNRDLRTGQAQMFDAAGLPHAPRTRVPNSRAALNVAELARERGVHGLLHDRLMHAFWAEDRDISDAEVLVEEASAFGIDPDQVRDAATAFPYQDRIDASSAAMLEMGAGGVPAWVVDDRVMIPGAQPHELFERVMEKLGHEPMTTST
jgi:predicted DsbA family dithiol-disulfide isomerase